MSSKNEAQLVESQVIVMAVVCSSPAPYTSSIKKKKNKALQAIHPKGNSYLGQLVPIFSSAFSEKTRGIVIASSSSAVGVVLKP